MNPKFIKATLVTGLAIATASVFAQPTMNDSNLTVATVVSGLDQPTSMAFLDAGDFLVLEKATGKVQHVAKGSILETSLDLPVNSASERGLLGIALHPDFPVNPSIYLYYTKSSTGVDSTVLSEVPLVGNTVDRFIWNGHTLTFAQHILSLRSYQADIGQPLRGNHNGGVIRFGPDRKLYVLIGDNGRRGWLQNNLAGPNPDDQFGGPFPDEPHTTGCIYRLNEDGSTPSDNPFVADGISPTVDKLFMYGARNGIGMAFDPLNGQLWTCENGGTSFDEINRVSAGMNGGWIQVMGPLSRVSQFHDIENTLNGLQQLRYPPSRIATNPFLAYRRMYSIPGSRYTDPQFSWKWAVAPAGIGFIHTTSLGPDYTDTLFVGAARTFLANGFLMQFKFSPDRKKFVFTDPRLFDLVADNSDKFDPTESESLIIGQGFGIGVDIQVGPNGQVCLVSLDQGIVYEIKKR